MKIWKIPAYVGQSAAEGFKEYLADHQNPKNRLGHHVGTVVGIGGGITAIVVCGVPPEIAVPAGAAAVYACAIPSHPLFEKNTSATVQRIKEIKSIRDVPAKVGKALFYVVCEPVMSLLAFTGLLRPIMRKMGLNPLGTGPIEAQAIQELKEPLPKTEAP